VLGVEGTGPGLVGAWAGPAYNMSTSTWGWVWGNPVRCVDNSVAVHGGVSHRIDHAGRHDQPPTYAHGWELAVADSSVDRHV
jgi:hypothetical protein